MGLKVNYVGADKDATWGSSAYTTIQTNPLFIIRSGNFWTSQFNNQAAVGSLWSGATYSDANGYNLNYNSGSIYPADYDNRGFGFPVRLAPLEKNKINYFHRIITK